MRIFLVFLFILGLSNQGNTQEDNLGEGDFIIANHGPTLEVHLHSLNQKGYLPNLSGKIPQEELTYQLKILLNEKDDSLKELTIKIGEKNFSFDPKILPQNADFDLNSLKIIPIAPIYKNGNWYWWLKIELSLGPPLGDCTWDENFSLTFLKQKYLAEIDLNTEKGFELLFYDLSEFCIAN